MPRSLEEDDFVARLLAIQSDLRAFILSLVPHSVDADDLLQEVNHALLRKSGGHPGGGDFRRWAFGFAAIEVRSFRRRAAKDRLWFDDSTLDAIVDEWMQGAAEMAECRAALAECIARLRDEERQVIQWRYGQESTFKQIAERVQKPLTTIYETYKRALRSLRECVTRSHTAPGRG